MGFNSGFKGLICKEFEIGDKRTKGTSKTYAFSVRFGNVIIWRPVGKRKDTGPSLLLSSTGYTCYTFWSVKIICYHTV